MKIGKNYSVTLDRRAAARFLGVSVVTLDREVARGRISHFRIGRRVLFSQEFLEDFLRENFVASKQKRGGRGRR